MQGSVEIKGVKFRDALKGGREPELQVNCSLRCTSLFPTWDYIGASSCFSLLSCQLLIILHVTSSKNFSQKPQSKLSSPILFFHHTLHLFLNFTALSTVGNYTFFSIRISLLLVSPIIRLKATWEEACLVWLMLVFLALSMVSGTYEMPSTHLLNLSLKLLSVLPSTERYFNFTVQEQRYVCEVFVREV